MEGMMVGKEGYDVRMTRFRTVYPLKGKEKVTLDIEMADWVGYSISKAFRLLEIK